MLLEKKLQMDIGAEGWCWATEFQYCRAPAPITAMRHRWGYFCHSVGTSKLSRL